MVELDHTAIGELAQILDTLESILHELRRADERGGADDLQTVTWAAGATVEYDYDGTYTSVGIFNLSAGIINVSLTPNGAASAARALLTLSARGFIVLPYRGTHVSVGGAGAGSALLVPCRIAQPLNGGTF